MNKVLITIPSYKRGNDQSTNYILYKLKKLRYLRNVDILTFVYEFDPTIEIYKKKKQILNLHIISSNFISKPNLVQKRNYILNYAKEMKYKYVLMIDDDLKVISNLTTISQFIKDGVTIMETFSDVPIVCPGYRTSDYLKYPNGEDDCFVEQTQLLNIDTLFQYDINYGTENLPGEDCHIGLCAFEKKLRTFKITKHIIVCSTSEYQGDTGIAYRYGGKTKEDTQDNTLLALHPILVNNKILKKGELGLIIDKNNLEKYRKMEE